MDFHTATLARFRQVCSAAGATLPQDYLDHAVTEREVVDVKNIWSTAKGMPPDLRARAAFQADAVAACARTFSHAKADMFGVWRMRIFCYVKSQPKRLPNNERCQHLAARFRGHLAQRSHRESRHS